MRAWPGQRGRGPAGTGSPSARTRTRGGNRRNDAARSRNAPPWPPRTCGQAPASRSPHPVIPPAAPRLQPQPPRHPRRRAGPASAGLSAFPRSAASGRTRRPRPGSPGPTPAPPPSRTGTIAAGPCHRSGSSPPTGRTPARPSGKRRPERPARPQDRPAETAPTDHLSPAGHPPTGQPAPPHQHPAHLQPWAGTVTDAKPACPLNWEDTTGSSVNRPYPLKFASASSLPECAKVTVASSRMQVTPVQHPCPRPAPRAARRAGPPTCAHACRRAAFTAAVIRRVRPAPAAGRSPPASATPSAPTPPARTAPADRPSPGNR